MGLKKFRNFLNHKIGQNKNSQPILGCKRFLFLSVLFLIGIILICLLFSINLVLGTIQLGGGNYSGDIETIYGPSQAIKGWINISLANEPLDSLLNAFDSNIKIIDFLKNNLENKYNCTPRDCSNSYDVSNPAVSKTFSLKKGESKIIGLKLTGNLLDSPISSVSFNFYSSAPESCFEQLRIDITDDNVTDYIPITGSGNYDCHSLYWGCYNSGASITKRKLLTTADYCERIRVSKSTSFKIGAYIDVENIENPKTSEMTMTLLDSDENPLANCNIPYITGSSEVSCLVNVSILENSDVYVCIKAKSQNDYTIDAENQAPTCGFYDIENHIDLLWDYALFLQSGKYAPLGSFVFDDTALRNYDKTDNKKLAEYLNDYISDKYNNNCQNGCVIPLRFIAGEDQQITLSNLILEYNTDSGGLDENDFYDVIKNSAKLNSGFLKLDLGKANLSVSSEIKNDTAIIKIGETEILRKNIEIKAVPVIKEIMPLNPPAAVPVSFSVIIDRAEANMSYEWDFGDSSSQVTTNENTIKHTYVAIGKYSLTVKAIGKNGEYSKTFEINVVSPKSLINKTISEYEEGIKNTENQISQLPEWMKTEVEKKINLTDIQDSIRRQKRNYAEGIIDGAKAVQIMKALLELKVPTRIYVSLEVQPSGFLLKKEAVDIDLLSEIGAGKINATKDEYYRGMVSWLRDNLNVSVESKIYSVSYKDKNDEIIFSDVKMNLNSKKNIRELYFVINGDPDKIKFNEDLKTKEEINSVTIVLDDLSESKTIEFLYPEAIDILNLPIYISPEFKYLPKMVDIFCNLNNECDSNLGEDYQNCSDCEGPWFWKAFFWIIILLVIAFVVYVILQEWYKRYYESSLFKDKNKLFNLINYINNCELQEIARAGVYKKLKGMQWKDEQIDYAWNKLHGLRTGMWEIPLFKVFENNKIKDELRKRQQIGEKISPATPPKVSTGFLPRNTRRSPPRNQSRFPSGRFKR